MQTYLVGGAVRDALLNPHTPTASPSDRDWVVVGSTPEALAALGFVPVGRDFPVFLHPQTREEYALARTERKTARGYHGFAFQADASVTLEQDLARRDLSINAMAVAAERLRPDGSFDAADVIDPYNGQADLRAGVLRHVTTAFAEDPVRILRLARFAARLPRFTIAPETQTLMTAMVADGEVNHLVAERVWQELARGLMAERPSRLLDVLRSCGALRVLLPELDKLWGVPQRADHHPEVDTGVHMQLVLDMSAQLAAPLPVRFACLCHDLGKGNTPTDVLPRHIGHEQRSVKLLRAVCERLRVPRECKELAEVVAREHGNIHRSADLNAAAALRLLDRCDALRRPARFESVLLACECDARGRQGLNNQPYPQAPRLQAALQAALTVDTAAIAQRITERMKQTANENRPPQHPGQAGLHIAAAIAQARETAIAAVFSIPHAA